MSSPQVPVRDPSNEENWLLADLPNEDYQRVMAQCDVVLLVVKDVVITCDAPIDYVYFPRRGCISLVTVMGDGRCVEVGTAGREGMAGTSLAHGVRAVPTRGTVQIGGQAVRMPAASFSLELRENHALRHLVLTYAQVWADIIGRAGSCNAVHSVQERCARWLLMTDDRVEGGVLPLTQEALAIMLGVRRASVTVAAASLQRAELIDYKHGKISVLDRPGLESASCECYSVIRDAYARRLKTRSRPGSLS